MCNPFGRSGFVDIKRKRILKECDRHKGVLSMKKIFALALALIMVMCAGISASAAGSELFSERPFLLWQEEVSGDSSSGAFVHSMENGARIRFISEEDMQIYTIDQAMNELKGEDLKLFKEGYNKAMEQENAKDIRYFFWFGLADGKELREGEYLDMPFICESDGAAVMVNGEMMSVRPLVTECSNGPVPNGHFVQLTQLGAVAIWGTNAD